jgi:hypothetical protein
LDALYSVGIGVPSDGLRFGCAARGRGSQASALAAADGAIAADRAGVDQATGMLAVQLGVALDETFVRLRAHAFPDARPLRLLAREIVEGPPAS